MPAILGGIISPRQMPLVPGTRIGPYDVVGTLGAGGMGEVYRARDARLEREVALKILPESFGRDPDRLARFEREAKAVASLSHPNILAVFDTGTAAPTGGAAGSGHPVTYVVMELLTGETLGDRLKSGPLPVRKATEVAGLIARGLSAAHEKGLVHRDLKPDNVFLTSDGQVKLLDFGLARYAAEASEVHATRAAITDAGTVMGTVGYMAPEQVRGEAVDARADLFALGAVLYEMLAGERAFRRETSAETMTAILNEDPADFSPARSINPALDRIVRHCLEKRPAERFQTARDVAFALEALSASSSSSSAPAISDSPARGRIGAERMAWLAATLGLAAIAAWLAFGRPSGDVAPPPVIRASVALPPGTVLAQSILPSRRLAISPDGRRIAFLTEPIGGDGVSLWWQSLDAAAATLVPGTRRPEAPFWSPDSRHLGFADDGKLMRLSMDGGAPTSMSILATSAAWGPGDQLLITQGRQSVRLTTPGGSERTVFSGQGTGRGFYSLTLLAGNSGWLFMMADPGDATLTGAYVSNLDGTGLRQLMTWNPDTESINVFAAAGHLLMVRDRLIQARPFTPNHDALEGEWTVLAGPTEMAERTGAIYSASESVLAYQAATTGDGTRLVWYDRRGQRLGQLAADGTYSNLEISPDRTRLLVSMLDQQGRARDVWVLDLKRGVPSRVTFDPLDERSASWGLDGQSIVFRKGVDLYTKPLGAGVEQPFLVDGISKDPRAWSPDGSGLVYRVSGVNTSSDLWMKPAQGDPRPLVATPFAENYGEFSPDGRWLAYTSDESGQSDVYVTEFPSGQGKWRVSPDGGSLPRWRPDGRELYYLSATNQMVAVPVRSSPTTFDVDTPTVLFQTNAPRFAGYHYVTTDGERFLVNELLPVEGTPSISLVVNWPTLLKGLR